MERKAIHIIYPDDRYVSEETIKGWYEDAVANGEVIPADDDEPTIDIMLDALEDLGHITTKWR